MAWIHANDLAAASRVDANLVHTIAPPFDLHVEQRACGNHEVADRMLFAGCDDEILRFRLLQHEPLRADIVPGVTPIAARIQIAQIQSLLQADPDAGQRAGDLARYESLAAQRG